MTRKCSLVFLSLACALLCSAAGPTDAPPPDELHTATVAAFKNGLGFVLKQGEIPIQAGTGNISTVPEATLGSLWIAPNAAGTALDEVVAYRYRVSTRQSLTSLADVLLANAGKVVTVVDGNQKEYTGEVVGFRQTETPPPAPGRRPYPANNNNAALSSSNPIPVPVPATPEFVLLKSKGKLQALAFGNIVRVALPSDAILQEPQEQERTGLRFRTKGAGNLANITMGYLESGLGWTPSYLLTLQDESKAQLTMQAVLVNDMEDMKDTDVFFVVGVPNFSYSHLRSPMALQQSLLEFMQAAGESSSVRSSPYSNALIGQRAFGMIAGSLEAAGAPSFDSLFEELKGSPEEDLFLYNRKAVTLARGERATYNVFSDIVSYEHVYQWDVKDQPRVDGFGNVQTPNPNAPDRTAENSIWHSLRLKNSTKFPWTSAPALVISGSKPLSQDTLPYTSRSGSALLKLTIATDIRATQEEKEVAREQGIQRRRGYSYDHVTVEGTLKIKNYKAKEVKLGISKTVRGEVASLTDQGTADKLAEGISVDNPLSRLRWEIALKPGEERTITYRYKVWVRT